MKSNMNRLESSIPLLLLFLFYGILSGCAGNAMSPSEAGGIGGGLSSEAPGGADDFVIVDCRLPGQIRQLGQRMVYLSRGKSIKTTAKDCAVRGGEFALPDQTDYKKALMVWLPDAKAGDREAQYYAGEIYQRGLGAAPQYGLAAQWFRKSAEQGYAKAQMSLGYLYEKGLGVEKDSRQALSWYRRATGMGDLISLDQNSLGIEERRELEKLREENRRRIEETGTLKRNLEKLRKDLEEAREKLERPGDEADTKDRRREVAELERQIAADEKTIEKLRDKLARNEEKLRNLPPPRIEIYDPLPRATRGVPGETGTRDSQKRLIAGMVWAPAGLASFKVNQQPETVEEDGKFRLRVPINPEGDTLVQLVVVDQRGKKTSVTHKLEGEPATPSTAAEEIAGIETINFGRYHALVIGNINYRKLPRLKTAVNDAREMARVLKEKYNFETKLLLDATREEIIRALDHFRQTLTEKDNLLIYYAGHGYLDEKNNRGYWQPVDADPDSSANWISDYTITDQLNIMAANDVLVIADSCYSGILTRGVVAQLEPARSGDVRLQYIRQLSKGRARMVLTSGELAPVIDDGGGGHSVFAGVLLDVLKSNDRVIEGDRLHQEMSARVVYESRTFGLTQVPLYATNIQAGHESGDFIFVPLEYQQSIADRTFLLTSDHIPSNK